MRGAYYVVTALLVTASSRIIAESNQTEPLQTSDHEAVVPSGKVDDTLPLRKSRDPQDDLRLYEERMPLAPSNSLGKLKRPLIETADLIENEVNNVFAKAATPLEAHENLISQSEASTSKRQRIDPTPIDGDALPALPKSKHYSVSVAGNVPSVLEKRVMRNAHIAIIYNAAEFLKWHDFQPRRSSYSTSTFANPGDRLNLEEIARKAFEFIINKKPRKVKKYSEAHFQYLLDGKAKYAHPSTVHGTSVFEDWMSTTTGGLHVFKDFPVNDKIIKIHNAFRKAFNLPFCQYPQETAVMMKEVKRINSSPTQYHSVNAFKNLADKQNLSNLLHFWTQIRQSCWMESESWR